MTTPCGTFPGQVGGESVVTLPCTCEGDACGANQDPALVTVCMEGTMSPCTRTKPWTCPADMSDADKHAACQAMIGTSSYCKANPAGYDYCEATFARGTFSAPIPCCLRPK